MKQIEFTIDGQTSSIAYKVKGFVGKKCSEVAEVMARIGIVTGMTPTPEANKQVEKPAYNELHRGK
jgi:hypothetical protein